MIPFPDGSYEKHGMDAVKVYRPDETSVVKFRRIDVDTRWYVDAFNELFGDRTRYVILGEDVFGGTPVLKLRQPYVEFEECSWEAARRELFYDMKRRFGDAEEHPWMPNELHLPGWFLDDLKEANVGIDSHTHHYAVLDCIIHPLAQYAARSKDDAALRASSSGGVFTELARGVLAKKGVVVATGWNRQRGLASA